MTFALIIIVSVWGWKAVLHFLSIDPIMVVFGIYAVCFTPIIAFCAEPPAKWNKPLGVALLSRSIGAFLGGCVPLLIQSILSNSFSIMTDFVSVVAGFAIVYIILCVVAIMWRIFKEEIL
jgi:hypothetical protein